ncbi:MAG TPA: calcium/sodium antiporter [Bacteroidales bacterium]|mgnify:FL=1|nr:calcium/sodium antiporter [Bacteroidales bacterium]
MIVTILLLIAGLLLLIKGADWMVQGASSLARKYRISELIIGLTIVAFGTSAPELVVNVIAAFENHPDIVFGNIVGSNIVNLFLILGISGIITPLVVQRSTVWKEIPFSLFAALILFFLVNDVMFFKSKINMMGRIDGFILLVFFILFLVYIFRQMKKDKDLPQPETQIKNNFKIWLFILIGLASLVVGGKLIVNSAIQIANSLGVSEKVISLTIVAIGTSLPELATSVVAAIKKNKDLAVGNIIGSNIFNIFLILSISSLVRPISFDTIFNTDIFILVGGTIFLFTAMFTGEKKKLDRWEAIVLLIIYIGYTIYLIK